MAIIFEVITAVILIVFVALGAKRGLVLSLCGLLGVLVAFSGAGVLARTLSPAVADALEPRFAAAIEAQLEEQIAQRLEEAEAEGEPPRTDNLPLQDVLDALRDMGFYETLVNSVDRAVEQGMTGVAAGAAAKGAAAIAQSAAYLVLFLVGFIVILILWKVVGRALDLVARLPVLHFLNKTMGALFGLLQGCIILFIAAWAVQFMGGLIPPETVEQTVLLKFFMTTNPMNLLAGM